VIVVYKEKHMNRRNMTLGSMAFIALLASTACSPKDNSNETRETMGGGKIYPTYRYRLTVEVDTPEGLKTGSSVIEVATSKGSKFAIPSPGALSYKVRGEAVTVDLGARGLMFALLRSDESSDWAAGAFEAMAPETTIEERMKSDDAYGDSRAAALALQGPQVVPRWREPYRSATKQPRSGYPMLVRFADIADPKTVAKVDPDALAASFGKGVTLRRITVELTEDAVTTGIGGRLPQPDEKGFYGMQTTINGEQKIAALGNWEFSKGMGR
jgi:hypothetical protein